MLAWAKGGITAVAVVVLLLAIGLPVAWTVAHALRNDDEAVAMRQVSDDCAAEVARLASDRERLLSEVPRAEERERARLAETLHDGPMRRLMAMRQDALAARRHRPRSRASVEPVQAGHAGLRETTAGRDLA